MEGIKDARVEIERVSPDNGFHYFFGYYDNPAFDMAEKKHLCNKVNFQDRFPSAADICELGALDIKTGSWEHFSETRAFNFQQGCMLQWNPLNPETEIIYNTWEGDKLCSVIHNIKNNNRRVLPAAIANISPDGKWGLAINFGRIMDFRQVCGYAGAKDLWFDEAQPKDDGIRLINMETGEARLILNYRDMAKIFSLDPTTKIVINHITFSPDSRRLVFLLRNFPSSNEKWLTGLGTVDRDGNNLYLMNPMSMVSHYCWQDNNHLLAWASVKGVTGMHLITDQQDESMLLDPGFFTQDIHCIYSPNRKFILGDGYPDKEGYRHIYLYNTETRKGFLLLRAKSNPEVYGDIRCDLHNRWSDSGRFISFDSTHEGFRGLYLADMAAVK